LKRLYSRIWKTRISRCIKLNVFKIVEFQSYIINVHEFIEIRGIQGLSEQIVNEYETDLSNDLVNGKQKAIIINVYQPSEGETYEYHDENGELKTAVGDPDDPHRPLKVDVNHMQLGTENYGGTEPRKLVLDASNEYRFFLVPEELPDNEEVPETTLQPMEPIDGTSFEVIQIREGDDDVQLRAPEVIQSMIDFVQENAEKLNLDTHNANTMYGFMKGTIDSVTNRFNMRNLNRYHQGLGYETDFTFMARTHDGNFVSDGQPITVSLYNDRFRTGPMTSAELRLHPQIETESQSQVQVNIDLGTLESSVYREYTYGESIFETLFENTVNDREKARYVINELVQVIIIVILVNFCENTFRKFIQAHHGYGITDASEQHFTGKLIAVKDPDIKTYIFEMTDPEYKDNIKIYLAKKGDRAKAIAVADTNAADGKLDFLHMASLQLERGLKPHLIDLNVDNLELFRADMKPQQSIHDAVFGQDITGVFEAENHNQQITDVESGSKFQGKLYSTTHDVETIKGALMDFGMTRKELTVDPTKQLIRENLGERSLEAVRMIHKACSQSGQELRAPNKLRAVYESFLSTDYKVVHPLEGDPTVLGISV